MVTNMFLNIAVPGNKTDLQISGTFKTNVYGASAVSQKENKVKIK